MGSGEYLEIEGEELRLGRDCPLAASLPPLLNKVVSHRHCVIRRESGRWFLEDLASTNGTWVKGVGEVGRAVLHAGDVFSLGKRGPQFECVSGFGEEGPDTTIPE